MKYFIQIIIITIITVQWIGEVRSKPHKHIRKSTLIERRKLPIKHISLLLEKVTPFGKFEFKHVIKKREAELLEAPPKEIPVIEGTIDAISETEELPVESHSEPEVIITSIVKPIDDGKSLELLITPAHKINEVIEQPVSEVVISESESKPEVIESSVIEVVSPVVEITPKPIESPSELEIAVEPKVVINTVETSLPPPPPPPPPPIVTIPIYRTPSFSYVSSVIGNEAKTFLYTDVTKLPLSFASNLVPVAVPVPEIIPPLPPQPQPLPSPPLPPLLPQPPVIKDNVPPIKEETPNFFVKGSRLVLFVGSMMLQMLSRFVSGGFNINQIPIPIIPEVQ